MLKTISAALLAISVVAAPAMAAGIAKTTPVSKTTQAPAINAVKAKPNVMNSHARMGRHHHRFHKHVGANKPHQFSKVTVKHAKTAIRRG